MGIFRTILALAVCSAHCNMFYFGATFKSLGGVSVVSFYIISGFYMYLILDTKYNKMPGGMRLFYTNRLWRIYPSYFVVLLLSVLAMQLTRTTTILGWAQPTANFWKVVTHMDLLSLSVVVIANVFILFTNLVGYRGYFPDGTWSESFTTPGATPGWWLLLNPPAWTLAIELAFYVAAPIVARAGLFLLIPSLVVMHYCGPSGWFDSIAWHRLCNVLLPGELYYFLAGMVAYRVYKVVHTRSFAIPVGCVMTAALAIFTFFITIKEYYQAQLYWGLVWSTVPFLFALTKNSKIDRLIGEFSYAIYVCHFIVYKLVVWLVPAGAVDAVFYPALFAGSAALVFGVERPIERLRQRRVVQASQTPQPAVVGYQVVVGETLGERQENTSEFLVEGAQACAIK